MHAQISSFQHRLHAKPPYRQFFSFARIFMSWLARRPHRVLKTMHFLRRFILDSAEESNNKGAQRLDLNNNKKAHVQVLSAAGHHKQAQSTGSEMLQTQQNPTKSNQQLEMIQYKWLGQLLAGNNRKCNCKLQLFKGSVHDFLNGVSDARLLAQIH